MADIKRFLGEEALGTLVSQIKAEDSKVLEAAKKYTDDAPFDVQGAAATAKSEAIADADAKFTTVNENISKKADATALEAEVKRATDKEAELLAAIEATDAIADKAAEDILAINDSTNGILAQATGYVDGQISEVEGDLADLAEYVGTIPSTATATDIVGYVQEKTAGIATDTALEELTGRVVQAETDIDNIEKDYLKKADKDELAGDIADVQAAVEGEAATARAAEEANAAAIKAIADDYLKGADKTELQGNINTLTGVVETLRDGIDAEKVDGVKDLIAYVEEHGTEVTGMQGDIAQNASDISGVAGRMTTAEGNITTLQGDVAKKVDQTVYDQKIAALEGADSGLDTRLQAVEAKFGGGEGNVEAQIEAAVSAALETAAADATGKANAAETAAKGYTDTEVAKDRARLDALELIDHEHANKAELDLIASGDKAKWDEAAGKAHEHGNKGVIDGITAEKVAAWDAAEGNAKGYADGLNATMTGKVDGIDGRVKTLEETIVDKAEQDDLDAAVARIAANETAIAANTSAINSFTAITPDEVNALFA